MSRKMNKAWGDTWMLGEDIPDIDFFFSQIWLSCFVDEFKKPGGQAYRKILGIYRGYHLWFYYGEKDSYEVGEHIVNKFLEQPKFVQEVNAQIIRWSDKLRRQAEKIPEANLNKLSNRQLWSFYSGHNRLHTQYYQWGWIPVAADMFHNNLTIRLKERLRQKGLPEGKLSEIFIVLTQPTKKSLIQSEREEFLSLAAWLQTDVYHRKLLTRLYRSFGAYNEAKFGYQTHTPEYEALLEQQAGQLTSQIKPRALERIQAHYLKYFYVNHMWVGRASSFEHYLKELANLIGSGAKPAQVLRQEQAEFIKNTQRRKAVLRKYHITGKDKVLFDGFGDFMVTKIYRRFAQIFAMYKMEFVLQEIGNRLGLSLMEARFMLPAEVKRALATGRLNKVAIRKRTKICAMIVETGQEKVHTGEAARKLAKLVEDVKHGEVAELKGQTGCVGKARGTVKIIIRPSDMSKMRPGDVLVSIATDPDIVSAMKKAAAIVTEQGGVTSHAAIVARELNIPCVIGTKIATKVFKDGDVVEVDATNGIVKKL
ncbi:MAG: PEP-utilizing enzyme [Candidatus Veblenbacteria bacterium]|nr:PEP-utilizing enzyme [Candidatus Veblenbacteria bacterium]